MKIAVISVHLVFSRRITELEAEIKGEYQVSGWTDCLSETIKWAQAQQGSKPPDVFLINGLDHYRQHWKHKQKPSEILIELLTSLKQCQPDSRIKILLPEENSVDQELLIGLMQEAIYDFWFKDSISTEGLREILSMNRSFEELEQYLNTLPVPQISEPVNRKTKGRWFEGGEIDKLQQLFSMDTKKIRDTILDKVWPGKTEEPFMAEAKTKIKPEIKPEAKLDAKIESDADAKLNANEDVYEQDCQLKPVELTPDTVSEKLISLTANKNKLSAKDKQNNILAGTAIFWSEDDCVLSYAVAFLLAYYLAASGYKTVLVELPGQTPRLAAALGLRHPVWNIRNALKQFAYDQESSFDQYIFNGSAFRSSEQAYDRHQFIKHFPETLYFLPDAAEEDSIWQFTEMPDTQQHNTQNLRENQKLSDTQKLLAAWEPFMMSWLQWAMFQQKFQFIFYCGFGQSYYQKAVLKRMSYLKVFINQPWASGFKLAALAEVMWPGQNLFLWGHSPPFLKKEIKQLPQGACFRVPDCLYEDFLNISAFLQSPQQLQEESSQFLQMLGQAFLNGFVIPTQEPGFIAKLKGLSKRRF